MSYTLRTGTNAVTNDSTGQIVGPEHTDEWQQYQNWLQLGNRASNAPAVNKDPLYLYAKLSRDKLLSSGIIVNVAPSGQPIVNVLSDGTDSTKTDLLGLYMSALSSSGFTANWVDNNNNTTTLTAPEIIVLALAVRHWVSAMVTAYADITAKIGENIITTMSQIDSYSWPTS